MRIFFLLLLIIPLVELYFLIQVGGLIGALPTVLLTIFTAIAGLVLMRSQGLATIQRAQQEMSAGQSPESSMFEGVFIFLGGVLLFFPGLISDSLGLLFLVPFVRRFLIVQATKGMATKNYYRYQRGEQVYEGEWEQKPPRDPNVIEHERDIK
jgi:UPF0716 protein FxsA